MKYALALALAAFAGLASAQDLNVQDLHRKCGSEMKWISDPPISDGIGKPLPQADRMTLLDEARAKAKAQNKPIFWYGYRLQGSHMYRPNLVDSYALQTFFCDEDIINLVNTRCIGLRLAGDANVSGVTKVKALDTVEPVLALLSAEGEVLWKIDRVRTFDAVWFAAQLREALKKNSKAPESKDPEELIAWGEWEAAAALLEKQNEARSKYLLATVYRRLRQADKAREALAAAKADPTLADLIQAEEALLCLKQGKPDDARAALAKAAAGKSTRTPEALYYLACLDYQQGKEKEAAAGWQKLAQQFPGSHWGWKAASNLNRHKDSTPDGAASHGFEPLSWSPEATYGPLSSTVWPRTEKDVDDIARRGVEYLLAQQRSSGAWTDTRYAFWPSPEILPNTRTAITALAATALLEWRAVDPARIDKALERAEKYMLDEANMNRGHNEEVYADAYKILYLSRKKSEDAVQAMKPIVEKLVKSQDREGYWAHEYPNAFITAVIVQSLGLAREAGVKVPEKTFKQAANALKEQRGGNGTFAYDVQHPSATPKDSSARSALCESGLFVIGESSKEALGKALADYWKFYDRQERIRKCDFHSDGELGGFFFFHALFHSSQVAKMLDPKDQKANLEKFLAQVVKLPEIDGSFIDDHELGKSYGTAMGLLTLRNCVPK